MTAKQILGAALIALPFVVLIGFAVRDILECIEWRDALVGLAFVAAFVGLIALGVWLMLS